MRSLGPAQPAAKQPPFSLARHEIDVAYEFRAALAPCEHNLAAVKIFKFGTMGNADQSGAGQLFDQELHHLVLAFRVKCRSRFVKHDDFWIVQEQSREREPLLFAARQRLVPGRFLILDFVFQVRQPDLVERFLDLFGGPVIGRPGVRRAAAEA